MTVDDRSIGELERIEQALILRHKDDGFNSYSRALTPSSQ